jgi:REP element-mobilizing transposase RayT
MPKFHTRRNTRRIPQHDYSRPGQYFITICTYNRKELFGNIDNNRMILNKSGIIINKIWNDIPDHYSGISQIISMEL